MAKEQYKLYLKEAATGNSKTISETHPKLGIEASAFEAAGEALDEAYGYALDSVGLQSETTVWKAE